MTFKQNEFLRINIFCLIAYLRTMSRKVKNRIISDVHFTSYASLGKALARPEGKVLFVEGAVPGDVADVMITKSKKDWAEGRVVNFTKYSDERITPVCKHFGVCGGCKWQMLPYEKQLEYKEQEVRDVFRKMNITAEVMPIIGSEKIYQYRNKLEFAFSDKAFLPPAQFEKGDIAGKALGYHIPRFFDKILDITECHLMEDINDEIRNRFRQFALENDFPFYDVRKHEGWLRNMTVRYTTKGECMVNIAIKYKDPIAQEKITGFFKSTFPIITTLLFTINPKLNDSIYDLEPEVAYGPGYIYERLGNLKFKISPKSFFQTNTLQAIRLYDVAAEFAALTGSEIVYDLYCGTGSIGLYLHRHALKIIGVEVIEDAIKDARENAEINEVANAVFYSGDVIKVCNDEFFREHGRPDVVVVDPPRAGMHEKLVKKLLEMEPARIVYVSCNIATEARDLNLLKEKYLIKRLQPVDMFPQTHHIECVAELQKIPV